MWQPYGVVDYNLPCIASTLFHGVLGFGQDVTEPYMPDRVARQFGRVQKIPSPLIPPMRAKRVRSPRSYIVEYSNCLWVWTASDFHRIRVEDLGPATKDGHETTRDYMGWFLPRTHPRVLRHTIEDMGNVSSPSINKLIHIILNYTY